MAGWALRLESVGYETLWSGDLILADVLSPVPALLAAAQRLGLARAVLHSPELLILDEPANALDPAVVVEIREFLIDLAHEQGVTVFVSSHILGEVARMATRVGVIHAGRLVEELALDELERACRRRLVMDARDCQAARRVLEAAGSSVVANTSGALETWDADAVDHPQDVATLLVHSGAAPSRLCVEQDDLESHFLQIVGMQRGGTR